MLSFGKISTVKNIRKVIKELNLIKSEQLYLILTFGVYTMKIRQKIIQNVE